jgi:hypothetical protein
MNSVIASDSYLKMNSAKTIEYFTVKEVNSGPVEDSKQNALLVLNYEASLDTTINIRLVYHLLNLLSDWGG